MAVGRISGPLLKSNLLRQGKDLAFETDLLYIDVNNNRVGIKTATPGAQLSNSPAGNYALDIAGTTRTTNAEVLGDVNVGDINISGNSITTTAGQLNLSAPDGVLYNNFLEVDDLIISGNSIRATDSNQNFEIVTSGTGIVEVYGNTLVNGNIHATGNIRADGNITIGDQDTDSITINADITSNLTPDVSDTYDLGTPTKRWNNAYANNLTVDNLTLSGNITVQGLDLTARPGKVIYVATNGDDSNSGTHQNDPYATIEQALSVAVAGDHIYIYPGTYTEDFPLTVPTGVSIRGDGIRAVKIQPSALTNQKDAFILNGEVTIEDLTITGFYYNSSNNTGHAFRFNPTGADDSTGFQVTSRSPYIRNVSVITQGSVTTAQDPRGFGSGDAGRGAFLDGAVATPASNEASCLFQNATFITPGVDAITLTNGVRIEWLNSFTYFAFRSINAYDGSLGLAENGKTQLRVSGFSGTPVAPGHIISYYDTDGITILASGTVESVDNGKIIIDGKSLGFALPPETSGKQIFANGDAQLNTLIKKFGSSSLKLDGVGDSASVSTTADFGFGTGDFTVDGWFYATTLQTTTLLDFRNNQTNENAILIDCFNNAPRLFINGSYVMTGTQGFNLNVWTHFSIQRRSGYIKMYVNGANVGTVRTPKTITANGQSAVSSTQSKYGSQSIVLDGAGDYLTVADNSDFGFGAGNFTAEAWVRFDTTTGVRTIFDFRNNAAVDNGGWLRTIGDYELRWTVNGSTIFSFTSLNSAPYNYSTNTWHHIAVSRENSRTRFFFDGRQIGSEIIDSTNYGTSKPLTIGADYAGTTAVDGHIDHVRISTSARYTQDFTPTNVTNDSTTVLLIDCEEGIVDVADLYLNVNLGAAKPLVIGNNYDNLNGWIGYIDDVVIYKGTALHGVSFGVPTQEAVGNADTVLVARFNGSNGSTQLLDTNVPTQDIRFSTDATATNFTLVDYADFGAEVRSIASASIYGRFGVVGDGIGVRMYLISHNFAYIGNDYEVDNDASTVIQLNEVVDNNGAKIYYSSVDHKGDFRVGNQFHVNQDTGQVNFTSASLNIDVDQALTFTSGPNVTIISGDAIETGNVRISGNTVSTTSGDLNLDAFNDQINFLDDVNINGNLDVTGDITIGGNVTIGDETTDSINITAGIGSDIVPAVDNTYNVGSTTKRWNTVFANEAQIDSVNINTNVIQTNDTNADLELRASGTGSVRFENFTVSGDTLTNDSGDFTINPASGVFRVDGTGSVRIPTGTTGERPGTPLAGMMRYNTDDSVFEGYDGSNWVTLTGVYDLDRDTYITAEATPGADDDTIRFYAGGVLVANVNPTRFDVTSLQVDDIQISGNTLTTTGVDQDLILNAQGNGSIRIEDFKFEGNAITNIISAPIVLKTTGQGYIDVSDSGGFVLPVGITANRPLVPVTGMIRYNTADQRVELYDGNQWGSIAGSSGAVSIIDATEIAVEYALFLG